MNKQSIDEQMQLHRQLKTKEEMKTFWENQHKIISEEAQEEIEYSLALIENEIKAIGIKLNHQSMEIDQPTKSL